MPYLIDGHNLIPKVPGLSLEQEDDEIQLIQLLSNFAARSRKEVEVYFDNAAAGQKGPRRFGKVSAFFVPSRQTADHAIRLRLERLGKTARNWIVISSDMAVQSSAKMYHAEAVKSETFAQQLMNMQNREQKREIDISQQEIDEWLILFNKKQKK